ncbi:OOP family OmpA-OmpF porin [Homoserinimonas aerilata]|uniref:OOP family OmpA-OmpF porin n=1 Tax=Homoserinimonas aerilata TaxID=1162970 RepID=A0A542YKZ0_9MICO|nr:OmpA family protein [Homoserinimonas aerilata]TQL48755.1 OOP family OmpA-OmpF porin [Homoserinimonas aerilata]
MPPFALLAPVALATILLSGCASPAPEAAPASSSPSAKPKSAGVPVVPGYAVGDFPPVPLFLLPDLALLDSSASAFTIEVSDSFGDIPGMTVAPAHCDEAGTVISGQGSAQLYGDGSGNYTGPDGSIQNYGDGSGNATINGVTIQNYGDGSGNYSDGTVSIQNYGDGSGNYSGATLSIQIYGDGSGNYTDGTVSIQNYGDGSGNFTDGTVSIQNYGDGSGNYSDGTLSIQNRGDGTGEVNGVPVEVDPIPPVPELGVFPPLTALSPIESCGTTITFSDAVLFDFDKSDVRADAAATLSTVAEVLTAVKATQAVVSGHTDAIGSSDYNQTLSEARARSVVKALEGAGVGTALVAEGFGESRPVAANEIGGVDNPAGRQLNRRVEIFLPATF